MRLLIADVPAAKDGADGANGRPGEANGPDPGGVSADSTRPYAFSADLGRVFRPLEALGVELSVTKTPEATEAALSDGTFDVLVIDARAFGNGAKRPRSGTLALGDVPVLLVADPGDPIPAVVAGRALRGSQWDLVHRDAPPEELLLRLERIMDQVQLLEDLERARYHASHDDRTGLLRPLRFDARLREHFSAAQRHRLELALVLVDLDHFGQVNKTYDHTVGDELISRAGSVIRMSLRTEDVGARIGGDEFALILPYTQRVDAARVVTRLAGRFRALSGPPPQRHQGHGYDSEAPSIAVSASIGFETFDGTDLRSLEELRLHAETALRAAKERGGNQGVYFRSLAEDEEWAPKILQPMPPPTAEVFTAALNPMPPRDGQPKTLPLEPKDERLDSFND
ncbi:MAG: diguanylate cyclase (GGDEF)-like protein [Planctomycetota bacterium]|jgi:diguanylate cyclase (GGDEF)-like protein